MSTSSRDYLPTYLRTFEQTRNPIDPTHKDLIMEHFETSVVKELERKPWIRPSLDNPDETVESVLNHKQQLSGHQAKQFHKKIRFTYKFDRESNHVESRKKMNLLLRMKSPEEMEKITLPEYVDLREYSPGIYSQGTLGSCVAQSICASVQICNKYINQNQYRVSKWTMGEKAPLFRPSRLALYWHARLEEGFSSHEDSGSTMHSGLLALEKYKLCDESLWEYDVKKFKEEPPIETFLEGSKYTTVRYTKVNQDLNNIRLTLSKSYPVLFGICVYPSLTTKSVLTSGRIPMPQPHEKMSGGHALCMVGYDDEEEHFIIQNSWGTTWGDHGFGYLPYDYVTNPDHAGDFWSLEKFC